MDTKMRWVRLSEDKMVSGVASALAKQFDLAPWVVRLVWILAAFATFGGALLLYISCVIAFPLDTKTEEAKQKMLLGVCARIHERGDMEVGLARFIAIVLLVGTGGAALVGYIVLHFVLQQPTNTVKN